MSKTTATTDDAAVCDGICAIEYQGGVIDDIAKHAACRTSGANGECSAIDRGATAVRIDTAQNQGAVAEFSQLASAGNRSGKAAVRGLIEGQRGVVDDVALQAAGVAQQGTGADGPGDRGIGITGQAPSTGAGLLEELETLVLRRAADLADIKAAVAAAAQGQGITGTAACAAAADHVAGDAVTLLQCQPVVTVRQLYGVGARAAIGGKTAADAASGRDGAGPFDVDTDPTLARCARAGERTSANTANTTFATTYRAIVVERDKSTANAHPAITAAAPAAEAHAACATAAATYHPAVVKRKKQAVNRLSAVATIGTVARVTAGTTAYRALVDECRTLCKDRLPTMAAITANGAISNATVAAGAPAHQAAVVDRGAATNQPWPKRRADVTPILRVDS